MNLIDHKYYKNKIGVYKITNLVNGKVYIGSSCYSLYKRNFSHLSTLRNNSHPNKHLQATWNKYGEKNFYFSVLEICSFKEETLKKEEYYISYYKSFNPVHGYNIFEYCHTTFGNKWSKEAKEKRKGFGKGRKVSSDTKNKQSLALTGLKKSEIAKDKLRQLPKNNKGIVMLTLSGYYIKEFRNTVEAGKFLNIPNIAISEVVRGIRKTCKGYRFIYKEEWLKNPILKRIVSGNTTEISQYDLLDNYLRDFLSLKEAEIFLVKKGANANISACCKGNKNSAYGYKWKYKNK